MFRRNRRQKSQGTDAIEASRRLRAMALAVAGSPDVVEVHSDFPDVIGLVTDVPANGGHFTLVGLADGTTSVYTSYGGASIGLGAQRHVADMTHALLSVAQNHVEAFHDEDDGGLPSEGFIRFHLVTVPVGRFVDIPEDCFWGHEAHELMPLIVETHNLLAAIRETPPNS